mgnify:FL=1
MGSDDCGDYADGVDLGRGLRAAELERLGGDPGDVLYRGELWAAALSVFADQSGVMGRGNVRPLVCAFSHDMSLTT